MAIQTKQSILGTGLKTSLGLVLLSLGFLATLATLLGFLGSYWWAFDVLANLRFQYAAVLLGSGIIYGLIFGRATALLFMVMAIVNIVLVLPLYVSDQPEAASADDLTIVSFNVESTIRSQEAILAWLDESDADLVFLLDSTEEWVAPVDTESTYRVQNSLPIDRRFGITLLARTDADVELLRLGDRRDPVLRVETAIGEEPVVVYAVHPEAPTSEGDAALGEEVLDEVAALAAAETTPVVIVGDLSTTPWTATFKQLINDVGLLNSQDGYGLQPTWPGGNWFALAIPLDHALHSPEITTLSRSVGPHFGSDHRPLRVTFAIADDTEAAAGP